MLWSTAMPSHVSGVAARKGIERRSRQPAGQVVEGDVVLAASVGVDGEIEVDFGFFCEVGTGSIFGVCVGPEQQGENKN